MMESKCSAILKWESFQMFEEGHIKEGILLKRGKNDDKYRKRYFVLQVNECLVYYRDIKINDKPKRVIPVDKLDVYMVPDKMNIGNGLQLSFYENNCIHNIYLYSVAQFDIIDWYNAIKDVKMDKLVKNCHNKAAPESLLKCISSNIIKEGYMRKSGANPSCLLRKRWFTLIENSYLNCTLWWLRYYKHPLDSQPLGEIHIGKNSDGYQIELTTTFTGRKSDEKTFTLVTKHRSYDLVADSLKEKESWISFLNTALSRES